MSFIGTIGWFFSHCNLCGGRNRLCFCVSPKYPKDKIPYCRICILCMAKHSEVINWGWMRYKVDKTINEALESKHEEAEE